MKDWVASKMEQIQALYPESKIKERKQRWLDFYRHKQPKDRIPFVCTSYYEPYCAAPDFEERLRNCLDDIIIRASIEDDYIPSLFTGCRQSTIPSMFGAPEIIIGEDVTCEKILHCPEDILRLPKHQMIGVAKRWLEMEEYFLEETKGKLPIHVTDMQGPFDVAGQLWSYDEVFLLAYEHPDIYGELIQRLTDAFLDFWNAQKSLLGSNFVGTHLFAWNWVPEDFGASMSIDSLAMISGPFYQEFYQPYIEQAADRMGELAIHSCGDFSATIPPLCETRGVTALNAGQMSLRGMCDAGLKEDMLAITCTPFEEMEDLLTVYREKNSHISISLSNVWNTTKPFAQWTSEDFDRIKRIEIYMQEQLSC